MDPALGAGAGFGQTQEGKGRCGCGLFVDECRERMWAGSVAGAPSHCSSAAPSEHPGVPTATHTSRYQACFVAARK